VQPKRIQVVVTPYLVERLSSADGSRGRGAEPRGTVLRQRDCVTGSTGAVTDNEQGDTRSP
jgi:hypothetical protein